MTTRSQPLKMIAEDRQAHSSMSVLAGALMALLTLWLLLFAGLPSISAAATGSHCSSFSRQRTGCAGTLALAHVSDSESEEDEEEPETQAEGEHEGQGNENAASAEAEVEAEEGSTAANGSARSKGAGSVLLSHLRLTPQAKVALEQRQPAASYVGFSFTLSAPTRVQVTFVKQTSERGHKRWTTLADSLTQSVSQGRTALSLKGHNHLSPGRYRLTVKPASGRARSIYLSA